VLRFGLFSLHPITRFFIIRIRFWFSFGFLLGSITDGPIPADYLRRLPSPSGLASIRHESQPAKQVLAVTVY